MSKTSPGAAWQRQDVAGAFLDQRRVLIPLLDVQEDLIRRLLSKYERRIKRFVDLGSGDGAMSELVLSAEPASEAVLVDFSEPMLDRAPRRLERFPGRWQAITGDLADPSWLEGLPDGSHDAAVSAFAIHHLPAVRKRRLFSELFTLLEPGGIFVNMDFVSVDGPLQGMFDEQMVANLVRSERERGGERSPEQVERDFLQQKDTHEDRPDSAEDQVQWLRDAGFDATEVYFKWGEAAVFGATKPGED
jgi:tRNA (cmo5U34)-methyltransferase